MTMVYLPDLRRRALALHVLDAIRAQQIRAARLLGLSSTDADPLFAAHNTFAALEQAVDELLPEEVSA